MIESILKYIQNLLEAWQSRDSLRLLGSRRSPDWRDFRNEHVKDYCEFCLKDNLPLEVHHIQPFHLFPELELDPDNVVTGCRPCHLKFFNLGSFRSYNIDVKEDIEKMSTKIKQRP